MEIITPPEEDETGGPTNPDDTGTSSDITFEGDSYVGNPDDDDETVIDPKPTNPTPAPTPDPEPEPEYDFTGITASTITYKQWNSWDRDTRSAWRDYIGDLSKLTLDEKYNYYAVTEFQGGYDCGYENHYCVSKESHDDLIASMAEGCPYCGSSDCVSFFARLETHGYTDVNFEKCPKYNDNCDVCGLPENGESGDLICMKYLKDVDCYWCGELVTAGECHECIIP